MIDQLLAGCGICEPKRSRAIRNNKPLLNDPNVKILPMKPPATADSSDASAPNKSDAPRPRRGSQPVLQLPPNQHRSARSSSVSQSIAPPPADPWKTEEVRDHHRRNSETLQQMAAHLHKLSDSNCSRRKVDEYKAQVRHEHASCRAALLTPTASKISEQRERVAFLRQTLINRNATVLSEQVKLKPTMMTGGGMCRRSFEVQEVRQIQAKEKEIAEAMSEITDLSKKLEQAKNEDLRYEFKAAINSKSNEITTLGNEIRLLREVIDAKSSRLHSRQ
ncbi:hypothetical protein GUITHDRAFT_106637 [Guillardia theta CCMP2712]|uniref:Uncharacterized protein n=1 Tax=Guillardia theta (strain CCMP2712) TaxID=905079 RepID=L1JHM3_GUITC|nr:hypothetical protein GUITHDRAFT_106637 [Guillardia theta CCMP2712]EKX47649.1 hypothetical protein GUITHDRAFT_106637 [Guillardia theta CCMP2712]|eukprot:XP_005834629.1 hypothetical protein GUITHDRAFT_106637 [Guillardia theta CCMP2712]